MKQFLIRIGALIGLLISEAWLCRAPDWEPLLAFVTLLIAYIGLDGWQTFWHKELSDHDAKLLSQFRELIPECSPTIDFLRGHDWAVSFECRYIDPLFSIEDGWKTNHFEFDNKILNKALSDFRKANSTLMLLAATLTGRHHANIEVVTMDFNDFENSPQKIKDRDDLNKASTYLYEQYEAFALSIRKVFNKTVQTTA